jgi:hypothetical protein
MNLISVFFVLKIKKLKKRPFKTRGAGWTAFKLQENPGVVKEEGVIGVIIGVPMIPSFRYFPAVLTKNPTVPIIWHGRNGK